MKDDRLVRHIPLVNSIRRHHIAHHDTAIMMERNFNLTYPIADWFFGTSDLRCGLLKHIFNGYDNITVRPDLRRITRPRRNERSRVQAKSGNASLIGGIVVGLASFVLWTAIAREVGAASPPWLAAGLVVSTGIAAWIRAADL